MYEDDDEFEMPPSIQLDPIEEEEEDEDLEEELEEEESEVDPDDSDYPTNGEEEPTELDS